MPPRAWSGNGCRAGAISLRDGVTGIGRTPDRFSDQLAGSPAAETHAAGGTRIDAVAMSADAARTFAVQGRTDDPAQLRVSVETMTAMNTPLERSSERVAGTSQQQAAALQREQALVQDQQQVVSRAMA